jgi:hypothetical protein
MMGKDALFKTVEDALIPGNLPIVIIESKGTIDFRGICFAAYKLTGASFLHLSGFLP